MLENYKQLQNGVITQIVREPFSYDYTYSNNYNALGELGPRMGYLRLGHLIGSLGFIPQSIMDIGYGNGDFLRACDGVIPKRYASDVSPYPAPQDCVFIQDPYTIDVDVITMYDVLEHFEDIYSAANFKTKYLVVSMPECHYFDDKWFENWKHRKPNEHLWHFNKTSLVNFMQEIGFDLINITNVEDAIRKNNQSYSNIVTGVFVRK